MTGTLNSVSDRSETVKASMIDIKISFIQNDNDRKTDSFSKYDFFGSGRNSSGSLRSGQIEGLVQHRVPGYYTVYPVLIPGTRMDL